MRAKKGTFKVRFGFILHCTLKVNIKACLYVTLGNSHDIRFFHCLSQYEIFVPTLITT